MLGRTKYTFRCQNEFELILACVRFEFNRAEQSDLASISADDIDWEAFVALAVRHRVVPHVHDVSSRGGLATAPRGIHDKLAELNGEVVRHNLRLSAELIRIVRLFRGASLPIVAFKGPTLAYDLYGGLHLRQYGDLDLLIQPRDLRAAMKLFEELGYRAQATSLDGLSDRQLERVMSDSKSYELARVDECGPLLVDLHWRLSNDDSLFLTGCDTWEGLESRATISSEQVCTLPSSELTHYLAYHGGYHRWARLSWLCDLARSLQRLSRVELEELLSDSVPANNRRYLMVGMLLLERLDFIGEVSELIDATCRGKLEGLVARAYYVLSADEAVPLLSVLADGIWRYRLSGRARPLANSVVRFLRPKQRDLVHRGVVRPYLSRWQYIASRAFSSFRT